MALVTAVKVRSNFLHRNHVALLVVGEGSRKGLRSNCDDDLMAHLFSAARKDRSLRVLRGDVSKGSAGL